MDLDNDISRLELLLLRNHYCISDPVSTDFEEASTCVTCARHLIDGQFDKVLEVGKACGVFNVTPASDLESDKSNWLAAVEKYVNEKEEVKPYRKFLVLCVGVASLQVFVQNNWVGPLTEVTSLLPAVKDAVTSLLSLDGDAIRPCVRHIQCLWVAEGILLHCRQLIQSMTSDWWLMRCLQSHQALLDERSPTLKDIVIDIIDKFSKKEEIIANEQYTDLTLQFHLEAGHLCYFYYEPRQASDHFSQAEKLCGVDISLTGEMGKRTRYQQKSLSQLMLKVSRQDSAQPWSAQRGDTKPDVPKDITHDDDTVLEKIALSDDKEMVCELTGVQQAVIVGLCHRHRKSKEGQGDIVKEECVAYINGAAYQPQCWSVQTAALIMRSQWECESSRLVQRSMMQLEELVNQMRRPEPGPEVRLPLVYCCKLPPIWDVQLSLAALFEKIGALKAAMEVYERIQAWEQVISCYVHTGLRDKADRLIQEQLAVKETPSLWCYLGDLHNKAEHYEKAWTLSNGRFGRAQRSLGFLYLHHKEFEKALPCFEKSLKVNGLQVGVWFSYGCAAMACENYELAAKGFRRCVNLEGDNFQAWSNLATAYIRSDQKPRAFPVLQEALKCEYESWQLWDNYLLVCVDIGEFEEAIRAYHRLLDIKEKHSDTEVLEILVKAIREDLMDAHDHPVARLKPKLLELFGRITAKITSNADIWRLYSDIVKSCPGPEKSKEDQEKALQYLQKSHRCLTQAPGWEKDVKRSVDVMNKSTELAQVYIDYGTSSDKDKVQAKMMLGSARLMMKSVLAKVKQNHIDAITRGLLQDVQEPYKELEEKMAVVMETAQGLQT